MLCRSTETWSYNYLGYQTNVYKEPRECLSGPCKVLSLWSIGDKTTNVTIIAS